MLDMFITIFSIVATFTAVITIVSFIRFLDKRWIWFTIVFVLIFIATKQFDDFYFIYTGRNFWGSIKFEKVLCVLLPAMLLFGAMALVIVFSFIKWSKGEIREGVLTKSIIGTTVDGVLVVNPKGKVILYNNKFAELWEVPQEILVSRESEKFLQHVAKKVKDPKVFLEKIKYLYDHKIEKSYDEIELKDGRVLERYSSPLINGGDEYYGRVWFFKDITARERANRMALTQKIVNEGIIDTAISGILVIDADGKVVQFNKKFVEIWDIPQEILSFKDDNELLRYVVKELKEPDEFLERVKYLYVHKSERSHDEIEFKDGRFISRYSSPLIGADGLYQGRVWFFRDITDQKNIIKALADENILRKSILDTTPDGVLAVSSKNQVLLYNNKFSAIWGIPQSVIDMGDDNELLKYALKVIKNPDEFIKKVRELYADQTAKTHDEIEFKDGRSFERHSSPLFDANGTYRGRVWFFHEITEQKKFNQMLLDEKRILNESIVNTTIDGVLVTDSEGRVVLNNDRFVDICKIPQEILVSNDANKFIQYLAGLVKDTHRFLNMAQGFYVNKGEASREEFKLKDGRILDLYFSSLFGVDQKYKGKVWFFHDITDNKQKEEDLAYEVEFEKIVGQVVKHLVEIKSVDIYDGIKWALAKLTSFIGFDRANIFLVADDKKVKRCIYEWVKEGIEPSLSYPQEYPDDFLPMLEKILRRDKVLYIKEIASLDDDWIREKEFWLQGKVKSNICVALSAQSKYLGHVCFEYVINGANGEERRRLYKESNIDLLRAFGEIVAIILERKRIEEQLEKIANIDVLTALPNRHQFSTSADRMIAYSIRNNLVMAVLSLDVDNFKNINDTYGHGIGDLLLKEVGERCRTNIRVEDFIARMGGDEFVIVVFGLKDVLEVDGIVRKLTEVVGGEYNLEGNVINITVSIGIACYPRDGQDKQILLKNADIAMYKVKEGGKNNYQFFTKELQVTHQRQLDLENELQVALGKKEFFLVYQPQFDENKKIIGMEVLLRWHHPKRGLVLPEDFIPIAEGSNLIVSLGKWVLREAAKQYHEWNVLGLMSEITMSVNLSFRQIEKMSLVSCQEYFDIIKESNDSDLIKNFELELTETALMKHPDKAREVLQSLHAGKFGLAIDDFGSGYSSLRYLKYLPIQRIKIDQAFISGIAIRKEDEVIVDAAIVLASKLGFTVVAEGVENESQFEFLKNHGCKQFQGYYFSYPLEAAAMLELLKKNTKKHNMIKSTKKNKQTSV